MVSSIVDPEDPYIAVITKSTDGGATWQVQYQNIGQFYMNDISCADENTCYAAAEGYSDDGGVDGARMFVTHDGGATWTNQIVDKAAEASVLRVHAVSAMEAWGGGSHAELINGSMGTYICYIFESRFCVFSCCKRGVCWVDIST